MQNPEKRASRQRAARNTHYDEQADTDDYIDNGSNEIPSGGTGKALLIGLAAGIVGALISIAITFLGGPFYQGAAREASTAAATNIDTIAAALTCLGFFINLLVCFAAGIIAGRQTALRRPGFLAGALAGAIMFLCSFLARYIPNYPGNLTPQGSVNIAAVSRGLIASLIFLIIWFFIGGLIGLWGAASATRRRPSYAQRSE